MRELRQCIRRVILTGVCSTEHCRAETSIERIAAGIEHERFTAEELTTEYCRYLYNRHRVYTDVARIAGLNWRTVREKANEKKVTGAFAEHRPSR